LPGADENAIEQICKGSVFVLSSRFEGMPNALMEALAMGVPCVSTKCETGPEELINNGENGLLVDVGSKEHIASAILKIIHNPTLAKKLSENGKKLILTNSIDRISNQWLSYLKNL
jgi:glycosyltransferase involved in cell wall biosynthesis